MRTIRTKIYKFNELNETAQQKAIEKLYDLNVDYGWWQSTYDDAENIGLKLKYFDLDRNRNCEGEFIFDAEDVAKAILEEHGKSCETYKDAKTFLEDYLPKCETWGNSMDTNYELETEIEDLKDEFLKTLLEDYSIILQNEYDYLTGEKAIIESIEANEYEFTQDGRMI